MTDITLSYGEHSPENQKTLVLIHGAFSTRHEWDLTLPYLRPHYHVLVPDLPGHGLSHSIAPFTISKASSLIADLIINKAHESKAYIVGLSLGAHVALSLATNHPDSVEQLFVSGYSMFNPTALSPYLPYAIRLSQYVERAAPRSLVRYLMDGTDLARDDTAVCNLALCRQVAAALTSGEWPAAWEARTLIVAAGKCGLVPSNDDPDMARKLVRIAEPTSVEVVAYTHPFMRHPWHCQAPELFAETTRAWFEGRPMPSGFVKL